MKIIFLNAWSGKLREPIEKFLLDEARDTDIFCLQEVYEETKPFVRDCLPGFHEVAASKPMAFSTNFFGQAIYVKPNLPILQSGVLFEDENEIGLGLSAHVRFGEEDVHVCNFHGLTFATDDDKLDNPTRLLQSRKLIESFEGRSGIKIIGGDFNILPQAESIRMFEKNGYRDLIKEFDIKSTRSRIALEKYPGHEEYFSDYVFVSSETRVKNFSVPNVEISDHLPLVLEIEI